MLTWRSSIFCFNQSESGRYGAITLLSAFPIEIMRNSASLPPCGDKSEGAKDDVLEVDANAVSMGVSSEIS
jgi:hypothetical protein